MGVADRAYMGEGAKAGGFKGSLSGLKLEVERCPDCSREDSIKGAAVGGAVGYGVSWLLGGSLVGRVVGAALGATTGALAARYHLYLDWDPDRVRYGDDPSRGPVPPPSAPESPAPGSSGPQSH
jgi:hypothetical protein